MFAGSTAATRWPCPELVAGHGNIRTDQCVRERFRHVWSEDRWAMIATPSGSPLGGIAVTGAMRVLELVVLLALDIDHHAPKDILRGPPVRQARPADGRGLLPSNLLEDP